MIWVLFCITAFSFLTVVVAGIAAKDVIFDTKKTTWIKLTRHGRVFATCGLFLVVLPSVQYWFQNKADERRDTDLRKFISDSTMIPEQPVLTVGGHIDPQGIKWVKLEDGWNHYSINFVSEDGASCCYSLKISAVIVRLTDSRFIYRGPVDVRLHKSNELAKNEGLRWTFTVKDSIPYDWLLLWVRGSYADRNGSHPYKIDQVYYNRKIAGTFGVSGDVNKPKIIDLVRRNEKNDTL